MKIKIGDEVVLCNGKVVTITEQYSTTIFRASHAERVGVSLEYYKLADIIGFARQMPSETSAEWATECGVAAYKI